MFSYRSNYNKIPSDYKSCQWVLAFVVSHKTVVLFLFILDGQKIGLQRHCHIHMQPMLPFANSPFLLAVEGRSFPVPTSEAQGTRPTDQVKCFPRFLQAIAQERSKPNHRATSVRKELWNARMSTYFSCMTVIPRYPLIGCVQLLWFICYFDLMLWCFDSFNAFNLISLAAFATSAYRFFSSASAASSDSPLSPGLQATDQILVEQDSSQATMRRYSVSFKKDTGSNGSSKI